MPSLALTGRCFVSLSWSKMKSNLESQADVSPSVTQFQLKIGGPDSSLQNIPEEELRMPTAHWGVQRRACPSCQVTQKGLSGKSSVRWLCFSHPTYARMPVCICSWARHCTARGAVAVKSSSRGEAWFVERGVLVIRLLSVSGMLVG